MFLSGGGVGQFETSRCRKDVDTMRREKEAAVDACRRAQSRADEMQGELERATRSIAESADTVRRLESVKSSIPGLEVCVGAALLFF